MTGEDRSRGWEAVAGDLLAHRSQVGAEVVAQWAARLSPGSEVIDLGCGGGEPVSRVLAEAGHLLWGVDASPTLARAWARRFPGRPVACEAAEDCALFDRRFAGAVAVGLLFLLPEADQRRLLARIGAALVPGGRLLFSAPQQACEWRDLQTGRPSQSLGEAAYRAALAEAGMALEELLQDAGENCYFACVKVTLVV